MIVTLEDVQKAAQQLPDPAFALHYGKATYRIALFSLPPMQAIAYPDEPIDKYRVVVEFEVVRMITEGYRWRVRSEVFI